MLLADQIIAPRQDDTTDAGGAIGQTSAQHAVQHPAHPQQILERTQRPRNRTPGPSQVSPLRRNERPAAIRHHQQQLQPARPAHPPGHPKRTPLQRMARPHHPDHRREAIEVGSVSCLLSKLLLRHDIRFDDGPAWTQRPPRLAGWHRAGLARRAGHDARYPRRDRRARSSPRSARA